MPSRNILKYLQHLQIILTLMLSIRQVDFGALLIETRESYQYCSFKPVTTKEVPGIVQSFKMKKAKDVFWLSSEHLRFAPSCLYRGLSVLMKRILETGYVHPQLKRGILTPVLLNKRCYPSIQLHYLLRGRCWSEFTEPNKGSY